MRAPFQGGSTPSTPWWSTPPTLLPPRLTKLNEHPPLESCEGSGIPAWTFPIGKFVFLLRRRGYGADTPRVVRRRPPWGRAGGSPYRPTVPGDPPDGPPGIPRAKLNLKNSSFFQPAPNIQEVFGISEQNPLELIKFVLTLTVFAYHLPPRNGGQ